MKAYMRLIGSSPEQYNNAGDFAHPESLVLPSGFELVYGTPPSDALVYLPPEALPQVLSETLKACAQQLGIAGIVLTEEEASMITSVSSQLREMALWAPDATFKAQALALITGLPPMRPELENFRNLMLSKIPS